jgi:tRNA nucleotidyltransferase (CCA-adding enzyme)
MSTHIAIPDDLEHALRNAMPSFIYEALAEARAIAHALDIPCYLVGGPVRDLVLGNPIEDLDLVFEGDALAVAERFAQRNGAELVRHLAFGTGKVTFDDAEQPFHVDFITARRETYPHPAALPVVVPSTLHDDLARRDFTINTLAIRLAQPPVLIDQLGGIADLRAGLVRVLHDQSFTDDPTRILRGARFAARLGFKTEAHTAALARRAADAGMFERTTPVRILHEVWLAFREPAPERVFAILDEQGVLAHVFGGLRWRPEIAAAFGKARQLVVGEARRLVLLLLSLWWLAPDERGAVVDHYGFTAEERRLIAELDVLQDFITTAESVPMPSSALDRALRHLNDTTLVVGVIIAPPRARQMITQYRNVLRPTVTLLDGDDLRALGLPPGPRYRVLLEGVRAAQLDGAIRTRDEAVL